MTAVIRIRRDSSLDYSTIARILGPFRLNCYQGITFLELTDLRWNAAPFYILLDQLSSLVELWIEDSSTKNDNETPPHWGNPNTPTEFINELPRFYRQQKSLSKITFYAQKPQNAKGLIEFARRLNRRLEITVLSGCFTALECEQLQQVSILNVVVLYARRTEGIARRELVPTV